MDTNLEVAVVGATGVVGREILGALADRDHAPEHVTALGSERSEGEEVQYGEETLQVEKATPESFRGMKVVFLAVPPDAARTLAPAAQAAGAWTVDVSQAFAPDASIPLAAPTLRPELLQAPFQGRIVRTVSPVADAVLEALWPLRARIERVSFTALIASSSVGQRGIAELEQQTAHLLSGRDQEPGHFPHRLAFNAIPQLGDFDDGGRSADEASWEQDLSRVWGAGAFTATGVQVPLFYGHLVSLSARLSTPLTTEAARTALSANPRVKVLDDPKARVYPMPMLVTHDASVHLGRIRSSDEGRTLSLVLAFDNSGRAAQTALDTAELLVAKA
jgi:aspartate-semialdehyde dehydrogenase